MPLTRLKSPEAAARWLKEWVTGTLRTDSRQVRPGDAFIAWPGYANDGRRFVKAALDAGASTCLVDDEGIDAFGFADARIATLPRMKAATGQIADAFFEHPSAALDVIAVTGTNGKSSTAWWMAQALTMLDRRCGVVGTLGLGVPPTPAQPEGDITFTGLTTPDPVTLQAAFRDFADRGFVAAAMEASSIGIVEHRMAGTQVRVALFTNFTRDHLDYHGTMAQYWQAKRALFDSPGVQAVVTNLDDAHGVQLAQELAGRAIDVWTYSTQSDARLCADDLRYVDGGLAFELRERDGHGKAAPRVAMRSRLIGNYNASNLLAVVGGLRALGVSAEQVASVIPHLTPVPGRMQPVDVGPSSDEYVGRSPEGTAGPLGSGPALARHVGPSSDEYVGRSPEGTAGPLGSGPALAQPAAKWAQLPSVIVDYAHTPDALDKAVQALRPLATARGGALWCVFGCGGNRDASKRPLMGEIAARLADRVVITSDNPRHEDPAQILADIQAGVTITRNVAVIADRRVAIAQAVAQADAHDVILIAGKGHEDYQEIAGIKHPFSDIDQAMAALRSRSGA